MMLTSLLREYLNPSPMVRVSDIFWIPHSRVGFHAIELDERTLFLKGKNFVDKIRKNVKFLKSLKLKNPTGFHNVYRLIQSWNDYSMTGVPRAYNAIEMNFLSRVEDRFFRSVLYDDIFRGKFRKRNLRVHFSMTKIPVTLVFESRVESFDIHLNCISSNSILFEIPEMIKEKIDSCRLMEVHLSTGMLFECHKEEISKQFYDLKMERSEEEMRKERLTGYVIDRSKISYHKNTFEELRWGAHGSCYMCIPFDALKDSCLNRTADFDKLFKKCLEHFNNDINVMVERAS